MEIYMNILHFARNTRELARTLGVRYNQLNRILYAYDETGLRGTDKYYKSFDLNKKNGGVRHINAPTGELLCIQKRFQKSYKQVLKRITYHMALMLEEVSIQMRMFIIIRDMYLI